MHIDNLSISIENKCRYNNNPTMIAFIIASAVSMVIDNRQDIDFVFLHRRKKEG